MLAVMVDGEGSRHRFLLGALNEPGVTGVFDGVTDASASPGLPTGPCNSCHQNAHPSQRLLRRRNVSSRLPIGRVYRSRCGPRGHRGRSRSRQPARKLDVGRIGCRVSIGGAEEGDVRKNFTEEVDRLRGCAQRLLTAFCRRTTSRRQHGLPLSNAEGVETCEVLCCAEGSRHAE